MEDRRRMTIDRIPTPQPRPEGGHATAAHHDRIYVRDLVLDAWIGIHHHEQGDTQRVRIDVEADIAPAARNENIRNTLCYDFIIDGIRDILSRGHIKLTETLAEEIAAHVLGHRLAHRVMVRVEKIDRVPGARLGVQIVREKRAATPAEVLPLPGDAQD